MIETVHRLSDNPWPPQVVREAGELYVRLPVYDANGWHVHEHSFPIAQEHLDALRGSVPRHLVLWCALEQLCEQAGRRVNDPKSIKERRVPQPDQAQARHALDACLLGSHDDVEDYFLSANVDTRRLIAHGADPNLLRAGRLFAALGPNPTRTWNWRLVTQDDARRRKSR